MEVSFKDDNLDRLESDGSYDRGLSQVLVTAYRKRLQFIRNAPDERDFCALKSLRFKQLEGNRSQQHSMRLNDQYRLILELDGSGAEKTAVIVAIEDDHSLGERHA
jgi:toxin HigB-1